MYSGSSGRAVRCNRRGIRNVRVPFHPAPLPSSPPCSPSTLATPFSLSLALLDLSFLYPENKRNRYIWGIQSRPIMREIQPIGGGKPITRRTRLIMRNRTIVRGKTRSIRKSLFIQSIKSIGNIARSNSTSRNKPRGFRNVRELTKMQGISAKKPPPLW